MTKKELTKEQIERAGNNVASLWGAYMVGYQWKNNNTIIYTCVEDGEKFITELDINEIEEYL